jgi:hypothetical protein
MIGSAEIPSIKLSMIPTASISLARICVGEISRDHFQVLKVWKNTPLPNLASNGLEAVFEALPILAAALNP